MRDLKKVIQRTFALRQQRLQDRTKISWRYIWRTYDLQCCGSGSDVLRSDAELVSAYGVRNRSNVKFVKKLRRKSPRQDL